MKEKHFKFRENFWSIIKTMDDRKAGKLIKSVCGYAFENRIYEGNDPLMKNSLAFIKKALDDERQAVEYGKLGGKKSKELKQKKEQKKTNNKPIEEIFMGLFHPCDEKDKKGEYP